METVSFVLELVTPMFMGGADPQGPPEFRAASLKGLLRFWFRAIYPDSLALESRLFGSTANRSPVRLTTAVVKSVMGPKASDKYHEVSYLGYGLINYDRMVKKAVTVRPFFEVGSRFRVELAFTGPLAAADQEKVLRAFWALAMLGGLGARSRRGFGACKVVAVQGPKELLGKLPGWAFPQRAHYVQAVRQFLAAVPRPGGMAQYSHFSAGSRLLVGPVLEHGGKVFSGFNSFFQKQRSYYDDFRTKQRKTAGPPKDDHDLMLAFLTGKREPTTAPARAAFGLPHNYFFKTMGLKGGVDLMEGEAKGRRASPLLFHVQGLQEGGKACGVVIFLPAVLVPPGQKLVLSGEKVDQAKVAPPDFKAVEAFLKTLEEQGKKAGVERLL